MDWKKIGAAALAGAVGGCVADFDAYRHRNEPGQAWNWTVAISRVIQGAFVAAAGAAGFSAT
jgi:hypothetical protein